MQADHLIDLTSNVNALRDADPNLEALVCGTTDAEKALKMRDPDCIMTNKTKMDEKYCKKVCLEYKDPANPTHFCNAAHSVHTCKISNTKVANAGTGDPK